MSQRMPVDRISGRALPLRGQDVDTDRIIPARYLRAITFDGLEAHVFEDDRLQLEQAGQMHPFSNPAYQGAAILLVNRNFGCGSSREHAPQALQRWGIRAVIGESFSEIFFGNSLIIGLPCFAVPAAEVEAAMSAVESRPDLEIAVSVADLSVQFDDRIVTATMPPAARHVLVDGAWDATILLLENDDQVRRVASRLPYISGFAAL
jgi:3-isopropylmalate/(R)-2-methylmalate dehydratase small subunit